MPTRLLATAFAVVLVCHLALAKSARGHKELTSRHYSGLRPSIQPRSSHPEHGLPKDTRPLVHELFGRRKVYSIRYNYYRDCSKNIAQYLSCAKDKGINLRPGWRGVGRHGAKLLFVGNSYMLQIKQALVLGIRDSRIHREFYLLPDKSHCTSCPCVLHHHKNGSLESSCKPVDIRAMGLPSGMVCDSRVPGTENTNEQDTPVWCMDRVSKVELDDGAVIATVKNSPFMSHPQGVHDALASLELKMDSLDVIIANEGNDAEFTWGKCETCSGAWAASKPFTHFKSDLRHAMKRYKRGERTVRPKELIHSLHKHGFNGTLLYVHNEPWADIPEDVHARWRGAVKTVRPSFRVEPYELMSPTAHPDIVACGNVRCHGKHHVMPGPPTIRAGMIRDTVAKLFTDSGKKQ